MLDYVEQSSLPFCFDNILICENYIINCIRACSKLLSKINKILV